jgi:hypothetical protein
MTRLTAISARLDRPWETGTTVAAGSFCLVMIDRHSAGISAWRQ